MFSDTSSIIIITTSIGGSTLFCILYVCLCVKVKRQQVIESRIENPCRVEIAEDPKNISELENK